MHQSPLTTFLKLSKSCLYFLRIWFRWYTKCALFQKGNTWFRGAAIQKGEHVGALVECSVLRDFEESESWFQQGNPEEPLWEAHIPYCALQMHLCVGGSGHCCQCLLLLKVGILRLRLTLRPHLKYHGSIC